MLELTITSFIKMGQLEHVAQFQNIMSNAISGTDTAVQQAILKLRAADEIMFRLVTIDNDHLTGTKEKSSGAHLHIVESVEYHHQQVLSEQERDDKKAVLALFRAYTSMSHARLPPVHDKQGRFLAQALRFMVEVNDEHYKFVHPALEAEQNKVVG